MQKTNERLPGRDFRPHLSEELIPCQPTQPSPPTPVRPKSQLRNRVLWALQIVAALFFLAAGASKLAGVEYNVVVFEKVGFGQWFRYFTGVLEIAGALMLLRVRLAAVGAGLLSAVMVGALIADRVAIGGNGMPALVAFTVVAAIAWGRWPVSVLRRR